MGKENFRSYKSQKILGRLYRKIKDAAAKDGDANANIDASDLPYDMELEVDGASEHVAGAWRSKCLYNMQLKVLLGQYRVSSEGEVWSLSKHNSRKLEECLKNAYHSLRKEFRHMFEEEQLLLLADDDEKGMLYEKKASAVGQEDFEGALGRDCVASA